MHRAVFWLRFTRAYEKLKKALQQKGEEISLFLMGWLLIFDALMPQSLFEVRQSHSRSKWNVQDP